MELTISLTAESAININVENFKHKKSELAKKRVVLVSRLLDSLGDLMKGTEISVLNQIVLKTLVNILENMKVDFLLKNNYFLSSVELIYLHLPIKYFNQEITKNLDKFFSGSLIQYVV